MSTVKVSSGATLYYALCREAAATGWNEGVWGWQPNFINHELHSMWSPC